MARWKDEGFPNPEIAKATALLNSERMSFRVIGRVMMAKGMKKLRDEQVDAMYDDLNDRIATAKDRMSDAIERKISPKARTAILILATLAVMAGAIYAENKLFGKDRDEEKGNEDKSSTSSFVGNIDTHDVSDLNIEYDEKPNVR